MLTRERIELILNCGLGEITFEELTELCAVYRERLECDADGAGSPVMSKNELGARIVACKGWRWRPGMLLSSPVGASRVVVVEPDWLALDDLMGSGRGVHPSRALPDIDDPVTRGGLLELVRKASGDPGAHAFPRFDGSWCALVALDAEQPGRMGWRLRRTSTGMRWLAEFSAPTEAEALVAALEAAP